LQKHAPEKPFFNNKFPQIFTPKIYVKSNCARVRRELGAKLGANTARVNPDMACIKCELRQNHAEFTPIIYGILY